jgi:hypothetical protein
VNVAALQQFYEGAQERSGADSDRRLAPALHREDQVVEKIECKLLWRHGNVSI